MRIIGGRLKGKSINPPMGYKARPTTDFAREGLFNILGNEYEFEDLKVLDLFGGTGAVSYEFASRGAAHVWCVEMQRDNALFIRREAARLGLPEVTVVHTNVFDFLPICREKFDIIFADPPYALEGIDGLPDKVLERGLLHPDCYFILEHGGEHSFAGHPCFVKERNYGRVHFSFFRPPRILVQ
ncbi:MAG: RsmD family RNA methyltransferase [Bacteroidales bacterium]|nr:RsmD family RNA methyltransferase [Bacteroidales bacterium]